MRLTQKKIEDILTVILGEEGLPLIRELVGKENVSEFDLATKIKQDIKIVRRLLYTLYNHNLVGFNRKKDKQKGWYIYYWTLLPESIRFSYFKMKRDLLEKLNRQKEAENKELFFVCPNNCVRLNFDQGMDFEFHCPECGELINQDDSKQRKDVLEKRIVETEKELEKIVVQRKIKRKEVKAKKKETKTKKKVKKKTRTTKETIKKKPVKKTKKIIIKKKVAKKKVAKKPPHHDIKKIIKRSAKNSFHKKNFKKSRLTKKETC